MTAPAPFGTPTTFEYPSGLSQVVTLAKPSGVVDGDVLVAIIRSQSTIATGDYALAGWTRVGPAFSPSNATARAMGIYYKPIPSVSAETATSYAFTRSDTGSAGARQAAAMFILRGVDLANPIGGGSTDYIGTAVTNGKRIEAPTLGTGDFYQVGLYAAEFTSGIDPTPATPPTGATLVALSANAGAITTTRTGVVAYGKAVTAGEQMTAIWSANPSGIGGQMAAFRGKASVVPITYIVPQNTSIGHRGDSLDLPEMSMAGYASAAARGLPSLEFSVARTSDNVFFGLHDASLDRTSLNGPADGSGTVAVASALTWAQVQTYRINPPSTSPAGTPTQPYITAKQMFDTYASSRIIFVDAKVIPVGQYGDLLDLMDSYPNSKQHFIAKGFCDSTAWATAARARGYQSWGYFYTADVDAGKIATRASYWDMLGLEYSATQANWDLIKNVDNGAGGKKPVIGHIVNTTAAQTMAYAKGAYATMVSAVKANFGFTGKQMWDELFVGADPVTAVYVGSTRIWP